MEVQVSGFHQNLNSKIPITIGTIPLKPNALLPADNVAVNIQPDKKIGWVTAGNLYPTG